MKVQKMKSHGILVQEVFGTWFNPWDCCSRNGVPFWTHQTACFGVNHPFWVGGIFLGTHAKRLVWT